jgi:hypothetical protein
MRVLRALTFATGVVLLAFASMFAGEIYKIQNIDFDPPTPTSPSWSYSQAGTFNFFPVIVGLLGLGLVGVATVWTRRDSKSH